MSWEEGLLIPPFFFGHLDGRQFVVACLVWEALFRLCQFAIAIAVKVPFVVAGGSENRQARVEKLLRDGPSYAVSLIHAVLVVYIGLPVFLRTVHATTDDQYSGRNEAAEWLCAVFLGYLTQDVVHIFLVWPQLGGWDVIFHHATFFCCGAVCGYHALYIYPFTWLTLGEASTIFLNIRWFLLQSGRPASHIATWLVSLLFASSFAVTRFLIYGSGLAHMAYNHEVLVEIWQRHPSVAFVTVLIGMGFALNVIWLRKILSRVWKPVKLEKQE